MKKVLKMSAVFCAMFVAVQVSAQNNQNVVFKVGMDMKVVRIDDQGKGYPMEGVVPRIGVVKVVPENNLQNLYLTCHGCMLSKVEQGFSYNFGSYNKEITMTLTRNQKGKEIILWQRTLKLAD